MDGRSDIVASYLCAGIANQLISVNNVDTDLACLSVMTEKTTAHLPAIYTLNYGGPFWAIT